MMNNDRNYKKCKQRTMKKLKILLVISSFFCLSGESLVAANCKVQTILYEGEGVVVLQSEEKGEIGYQVVATILTFMLPKTAHAFCVRSVGDESICKAVYDVTSALVDLRGRKLIRGATRGIKWIASRGREKSTATISTRHLNIAMGARDVFEAYRELGCVKWTRVDAPFSLKNSYSFFSLVIENHTGEQLHFELSSDGVNWTTDKLDKGFKKDMAFIQNQSHGRYQNFGYLKIDGEVYLLYKGKAYTIEKSGVSGSDFNVFLKN
jgi:hypothetical protein